MTYRPIRHMHLHGVRALILAVTYFFAAPAGYCQMSNVEFDPAIPATWSVSVPGDLDPDFFFLFKNLSRRSVRDWAWADPVATQQQHAMAIVAITSARTRFSITMFSIFATTTPTTTW